MLIHIESTWAKIISAYILFQLHFFMCTKFLAKLQNIIFIFVENYKDTEKWTNMVKKSL